MPRKIDFNIGDTYGDLTIAAIYRDNKIAQLNEQGAEYTPNHGYN